MIENIVYFLTGIILQVTWVYTYKKITDDKITINIANTLVLLILCIIQLLLKRYNYNNLNAIISFLGIITDYHLFYKTGLKKAVIYGMIIWILSIILDLFTMILMLPINIAELNNLTLQFLSSISTIIMITILIIISKINIARKMINTLYQKINTIRINALTISTIIWSFFTIGYFSVKNMGNDKVLIGNLILGSASLIILIDMLYLHFQIYALKRTNKIIEKNDAINRKVIAQYKTIKHNIDNKLIGLKTVPNKEKEKVINQILKEQNESFYIKYDIEQMPRGISGLILEIIYQYKENNINIKIDNRIQENLLRILGVKNYNIMCDYLGTILKNALEASKESHEKIVLIEFEEKEKSVQVRITNSFKGKINVDDIGKLYYTTKDKGHGLGLYSIISRKRVKSEFSIKNNFFISKIAINKANN